MVQLCFAGGRFTLERTSVREITEGASTEGRNITNVKALVENIIAEENFDTSANVTVAVPFEKVYFQNFKTDISINEEVQRLIKYELEDDFPIPFDELVAGICGSRDLSGDNKEYLVCAVNRLDLQDRLNTIQQSHLKCSIVTADVCALYTVASVCCNLKDSGCSVVIHADNSRVILLITEKYEIICTRHFRYQDLNGASEDTPLTPVQVLSREIEMTLRSMYISCNGSKIKVFMSGSNELLNDLSAILPELMNCEIIPFNHLSKIDYSEQQQPNADNVIATGLALIGANEIQDVLNFIAIDKFGAAQTVETKRGLLIAGALLVIIGILLVARLLYELNYLDGQHEIVKKQIRDVFVQTLPEEKKIVNELAQLNEQLNSVQTEYNTYTTGLNDRVLPLKILQIISEKITPDQNVRINDISMDPGLVRLQGIAASFESVDNLMDVLRKVSEFETIEVPNIDVDPQSSGVRFTFLITTILK
jgi:type II secretory pathway component PulL